MSEPNRREFIASSSLLAANAIVLAPGSGVGNSLINQETSSSMTDEQKDAEFIYFAARTPYNTASGRYVKKLKANSVLEWFQSHWNSDLGPVDTVGSHFYVLHSLFSKEGDVAPPQSLEEVVSVIKKRCYNGGIVTQGDAIEFYTDDDESHLVYHWFTREFAEENPERVGFLIHDGWLPTDVDEDEDSKPMTFLISRTPSQTCDSELWDFFEIPGIRLNQTGNAVSVMNQKLGADSYWLNEFLQKVPAEFSWKQTIEKLVADECQWKKVKNESEFNCSTHICEMRQHVATHKNWASKPKEFHQFIVFDDLWAKTYPTLVKAIRRFEKKKILFS